jgi:hypothetical protein
MIVAPRSSGAMCQKNGARYFLTFCFRIKRISGGTDADDERSHGLKTGSLPVESNIRMTVAGVFYR